MSKKRPTPFVSAAESEGAMKAYMNAAGNRELAQLSSVYALVAKACGQQRPRWFVQGLQDVFAGRQTIDRFHRLACRKLGVDDGHRGYTLPPALAFAEFRARTVAAMEQLHERIIAEKAVAIGLWEAPNDAPDGQYGVSLVPGLDFSLAPEHLDTIASGLPTMMRQRRAQAGAIIGTAVGGYDVEKMEQPILIALISDGVERDAVVFAIKDEAGERRLVRQRVDEIPKNLWFEVMDHAITTVRKRARKTSSANEAAHVDT